MNGIRTEQLKKQNEKTSMNIHEYRRVRSNMENLVKLSCNERVSCKIVS